MAYKSRIIKSIVSNWFTEVMSNSNLKTACFNISLQNVYNVNSNLQKPNCVFQNFYVAFFASSFRFAIDCKYLSKVIFGHYGLVKIMHNPDSNWRILVYFQVFSQSCEIPGFFPVISYGSWRANLCVDNEGQVLHAPMNDKPENRKRKLFTAPNWNGKALFRY